MEPPPGTRNPSADRVPLAGLARALAQAGGLLAASFPRRSLLRRASGETLPADIDPRGRTPAHEDLRPGVVAPALCPGGIEAALPGAQPRRIEHQLAGDVRRAVQRRRAAPPS